jgi:hypothetical protein
MIEMTMSPPWLQASCGENSPPSDRNAWAKIAVSYVAHMDAEFPGVVTDYEIWNEPDAAGMCGVTNTLETYQALYATVAPLMKAQAAADGAMIHVGGPALSQYSAKWLQSLLTDAAIAPYLDFVSYHQYFEGPESLHIQWDSSLGHDSLYEDMQDPSSGAAGWYRQTAQLLKSMNLNIPIYITEFNTGSGPYQDCCRNDQTYAPVFTELYVTDLLDQAYEGSPVPGKILYSAGTAYPWTCLIGTVDANRNCLYSSNAALEPYPQYYALQLIAGTLGLEQGGFMAKSITPQAGSGGLAGTAFYTEGGDSIVLVNPTPRAYSSVPVVFLKSGLTNSSATLYQIVNGAGINSSSLALTGSRVRINIPPYSVQAITLAGH